MNERLIAAARAVVQRWHSIDWKAPHTADLIRELGAAADALAAQPARAGGDALMVDAMVDKAWARFEAETQRLDDLKQRFFAYDEEVGFDTYDTAEQAQAAAEESIAQYRAGATDEWDSDVENVCWGVILGRSEEVEVGEPNDDGERAVDYRLAALAAAPQPIAGYVADYDPQDPHTMSFFTLRPGQSVPSGCTAMCLATGAAAPQPAAAEPPPSPELTWLYTHCRAIGMTKKSESGKWEHDIALFTIDLQKQAASAAGQPAASTVPATEKQAALLAAFHEQEQQAGFYRVLRRGQHWSVIDGKGDVLRGEELDAAIANRLGIDAAPAAVERQPLPESECIKLLKFGQSSVEMVRRVERAHGIG